MPINLLLYILKIGEPLESEFILQEHINSEPFISFKTPYET